MLEQLNDYCYSVYSPTLNYGVVPNFTHVSELAGADGFGSVYLVRKEDAEAIVKTGTTSQFAGVVWNGRLWLDIDDYQTAEVVKERLLQMELGFVMFDSGGKGAHFGIRRDTDPSHLLPQLDKRWVLSHVPEADRSIYTHLHLFRLPGTIHAVTGRPKTLVFSATGSSIDVGQWKGKAVEEAKSVRPFVPSKQTSVFESLRIMGNTVPTTIGNRHPTMLQAAYALRDKEVDAHVCRWWVGEINKMCEEPKEDWELDKLIDSVYGMCG